MNNLQITDLKITKKVVAEIEYNHEELKAFLNDALADYVNVVVTLDTLQDSKKVMAELNKVANKVDKFRKDTKKELSKNIKPFEEETKELFFQLKEAREKISSQVDYFIEQEKVEKLIKVNLIIEQTKCEIPLKDKYLIQIIQKENYLNSSMSLTKVKEDVIAQFTYLKLSQDAEQAKIDTITAILDVYNEKLKFKYTFEDFEKYVDDEITIPELTQIVRKKVDARLNEQIAELERIKQERLKAVEDAKEEARLEAIRVAEVAEKKRIDDIAAIEKEKELEIRKLERQKVIDAQNADTAKKVVEQETAAILDNLTEFTPIEAMEDAETVTFEFSVTDTDERIETLKKYMSEYDYNFKLLF